MATLVADHPLVESLAVSREDILGGKPVFRGTRVPVHYLFDYLEQGLSLDYFLETFPSVPRDCAVGILRLGQWEIENALAA